MLNQITVTEIFLSGGPIGLLTHLLSFLGIFLGIFALIISFKHNKRKLPFSLKLLFLCAIATLLTGAFGTVIGYTATFAHLAAAGSDKITIMEHGLRISRLVVQVGLISFLLQLQIAMICLLILNSNSRKYNIPELSLLSQVKKIPLILYPTIILLIPAAFGIISSLWSIEYIIKTKPEEPIPVLMKMNMDYLLVVCILCSVVAILMLLILFVQMIYKKIKH